MFGDLVKAFERVVDEKEAENGAPQITTKVPEAPDDAARFQIKRSAETLTLYGRRVV